MFVVSLAGFAFVILSMAEMASMAPTSGGQYHASVPCICDLAIGFTNFLQWVSEFAPREAQKFLSYITGIVTIHP